MSGSCPNMFFPTFFKLSATTSPVTTISNSLLTAGHFLDSSGVVGFLLVVAFHLVGNHPPTYITPLVSLPLIMYGRLAFLPLCISTTVTVVSFLSLMAVFLLLIKMWPTQLSFLRVLSFPPLVISLAWKNLLWCLASKCPTWVSFQTLRNRPHKKEKFLILLKRVLSSGTINLVTLQRLGGKCISMALAVPGARLYTNEIDLALSRAVRSSRPIKLSGPLRQELEHWLFLETWNGFLPWRSERHFHFRLSSDSSSFAWRVY